MAKDKVTKPIVVDALRKLLVEHASLLRQTNRFESNHTNYVRNLLGLHDRFLKEKEIDNEAKQQRVDITAISNNCSSKKDSLQS